MRLLVAVRYNPIQHDNTVILFATVMLCRDRVLNELCMALRYGVPLDRRGIEMKGREKSSREGGKCGMQSRESLTDVAKGCVLRVVENKRGGGCRERERDRLLTSMLQYTSVLPKRESTP